MMDETEDSIEEIAPGDEEEVADVLNTAHPPDSDSESADSDDESTDRGESSADVGSGQIVIVPLHEHRTLRFMTQKEFAQVLALRSQQIAKTGTAFAEGNTPREKAINEIVKKKCPLKVHRRIGNNVEVIPINDLDLPPGVSVDS